MTVNDIPTGENEQMSGDRSTATPSLQIRGQSNLELAFQDVAAGTPAVSNSLKDTGQRGNPETSSNDKRGLSLSPTSNRANDEHIKSSQQVQSCEEQSNLDCIGAGTPGSAETPGSSSNGSAALDSSQVRTRKESTVRTLMPPVFTIYM